MSFTFQCPRCQVKTEVADRYAGQSGRCASCNAPITLPGDPLASNRSGARSRMPNGVYLIASALGLLLIGGLLLGLILLVIAKSSGLGLIAPSSATRFGSTAEVVGCANNLTRIGQAILRYEQDKGHFPPAYVVDKDGKPLYSWRVIILPYLGEDALYAAFDKAKPWDAPENMALISRMPSVYRCPTEVDIDDESCYLAIRGEGLFFDGSQGRKRNELVDPIESILMVVEARKTGIAWTEPRDFIDTQVDWNRQQANGIGSQHLSGGFHILTADGEVHHLGPMVTAEALHAMATVEGNEACDPRSWSE